MATAEKPREQPRTEIDAVTLEVMRNRFVQICEEVTITLLKTAHSVIFNEGKDLSSAVFDNHALSIWRPLGRSIEPLIEGEAGRRISC